MLPLENNDDIIFFKNAFKYDVNPFAYNKMIDIKNCENQFLKYNENIVFTTSFKKIDQKDKLEIIKSQMSQNKSITENKTILIEDFLIDLKNKIDSSDWLSLFCNYYVYDENTYKQDIIKIKSFYNNQITFNDLFFGFSESEFKANFPLSTFNILDFNKEININKSGNGLIKFIHKSFPENKFSIQIIDNLFYMEFSKIEKL